MAKTKRTKQKPLETEIPHETSRSPQPAPHPATPQPELQIQPEWPQQSANISEVGDDPNGDMMEMGAAESGWGTATQTSWPTTTPGTGAWGFDKQAPARGATVSAKQQAPSAKQSQNGWGTSRNEQRTPAWGDWGRETQGQGPNNDWEEEEEYEEEEENYEDDRWGANTTAGAWSTQATQATGGWGTAQNPASAWNTQTPSTGNWGAAAPASAWKAAAPPRAPAPRSGWRNWGEEAKRLSKTNVPHAPAGNRTSVNSQQRAQIYNAFPGPGNPSAQVPDQRSKAATDYLSQILSNQRQHAQPQQSEKKSKKKQNKEDKKASKQQRPQSEKTDGLGWTDGGHDSWGKSSAWEGDGGWGSGAGRAGEGGGGWGGGGGGGWGEDTGWGTIEEEEEYEEDDRRVRFTPSNAWSDTSRQTSLWTKEKHKDTPYDMPSKTLAHAYNGTSTSLHTTLPRNKIGEYTNIEFYDSNGDALASVQQALFGRARRAQDRLHWMFPSDKDERVDSVINWIQTVSYDLGTYGLHRFLQSRERGALFTNAAYRPAGKNEPAFDWLTFDQLQATRDKIIQESVALYNPSKQVIVFVFLPSPSGNSVAIWRRRINVPNNMRLMLQAEINHSLAGLRREEEYLVHVDEIPQSPKSKRVSGGGALYSAAEVKKTKKKRKWWQFW